jgi:SAM-dependent methyltransferase
VPEGSVLGIDSHSESIREATLEQTQGKGNVTFQVRDIAELAPEGSLFDIVWESRALHGVLDAAAGLQSLFRAVKPGGLIVLREGGITPRFLPWAGLDTRLRYYKDLRNARNPNVCQSVGWRRLLLEAGFCDIATKTFLQEEVSPFSLQTIAYLKYDLGRFLDGTTYDPYIPDHLIGQANLDKAVLAEALRLPVPSFFEREDLHLLHGLSVYAGRKREGTEL